MARRSSRKSSEITPGPTNKGGATLETIMNQDQVNELKDSLMAFASDLDSNRPGPLQLKEYADRVRAIAASLPTEPAGEGS